jgi:biopolymer transport protein ExbB
VLKFFVQGGIVLIPIVVLSVVAVALIVERLIYFYRVRETISDLGLHVVTLLPKGGVKQASRELEQKESPQAKVLLIGLKERQIATDARFIHRRMEAEALRHTAELEKNVPYLASIANIATLLGLLGTVTGMIISFLNLKISGISDPALLAGGISQALITTAAGLTVAIPCLLFFHIFRQRVNRILTHIEIDTAELLSFFTHYQSSRQVRKKKPAE